MQARRLGMRRSYLGRCPSKHCLCPKREMCLPMQGFCPPKKQDRSSSSSWHFGVVPLVSPLFKGKNKSRFFFSSPLTNWIFFTKKHSCRSSVHFDYSLGVVAEGVSFCKSCKIFNKLLYNAYKLSTAIDSSYKCLK